MWKIEIPALVRLFEHLCVKSHADIDVVMQSSHRKSALLEVARDDSRVEHREDAMFWPAQMKAWEAESAIRASLQTEK
jgi:hypothetical protein